MSIALTSAITPANPEQSPTVTPSPLRPPAITDDAFRSALRSTRIIPRTAMHKGAFARAQRRRGGRDGGGGGVRKPGGEAVASQERCKQPRTQAPAGSYAATVTVSASTSSSSL